MKALRTYRRLVKEFEAERKYALQNLECAEHDFNEAMCKNTWDALEKAQEKYNAICDQIAAVREVIDHYEFYKACWEEEQEQALGYELAFSNH